MEDITADEFANCHAEVGEETNARDAHAGIVLIGRGQVYIIVMVVVGVAVGAVTPGLRHWGCYESATGGTELNMGQPDDGTGFN